MRVILMTALLFLGGCASQSLQVYEQTGEKQCEGGGLTLAESQAKLTSAGIAVQDSSCGIQTGVAMMAMCGGPTANIYTHKINADDFEKARQLGFADLESLVNSERGTGYELQPCP